MHSVPLTLKRLAPVVYGARRPLTDLGDGHGLDLAGVADVRPATEVDQWATLVYGGCVRVDFLVQNSHLKHHRESGLGTELFFELV